jgi:hypothetical protein
VPIAWIVRRVCVGDCRLCACSVCVCVRVCVCVCVVCIHVCAMLPAQGSRCLAGGGMLSFRPARTHRRTVNATVRPVCCPASLAAEHACAQSCAVQGGSSQRACVVKPLTCVCDCASWLRPACVWVCELGTGPHSTAALMQVCAVVCRGPTVVIIDGGRWALCMCVSRGKPRCVSSD